MGSCSNNSEFVVVLLASGVVSGMLWETAQCGTGSDAWDSAL